MVKLVRRTLAAVEHSDRTTPDVRDFCAATGEAG